MSPFGAFTSADETDLKFYDVDGKLKRTEFWPRFLDYSSHLGLIPKTVVGVR